MKAFYGLKARMAYIEFRNKISIYFVLWLLAIVSGLSLLIAGIYLYNTTLKLWTSLLAVIIFLYLAHTVWLHAQGEYSKFKEEEIK